MKRTFGIIVNDAGWITLTQRRTELTITGTTDKWLKAQGAQKGTKIIVSTRSS